MANLVYLMGDDGTGERFDKYVMNSLIAERELLQEIKQNIQRRGDTLDIEQRMMRSLNNSAKAGGIEDVSTLPGRPKIGWSRVEDRVKMLGPAAYIAYRMGSSQTHGDWTDLYRNHLTYTDGSFAPNMSPFEVRPQVPLMITRLYVVFVGGSLQHFVVGDLAVGLVSLLADLETRTQRVDELHEQLIQRA